MRELRKVFNSVSGMKSEKDIEKGYCKIISAHEALYAKSQQMREEAEKNILYERMLDFVRTPTFPPKLITAEDLRNEYWKMVLTKCRQELEVIQASNADFDKLLTSLSTKYPDESQSLVKLRECVEKEKEQEAMKLLKEAAVWSHQQSKLGGSL